MLIRSEKKIIIGYDLANTSSQISYCYQKEESDVETVGTIEGEENYDIPTVLCKRVGTNQWLFGHAALRFAGEHPEECILVENLLQLALEGNAVEIDGKGYHPATLLALFVKRSLSTVAAARGGDRIRAIMFTSQVLDGRMKALIQRIIRTLELKNTEIYSQCYEESFFAYLMHQSKSLWSEGAMLLDYRGEDLIAMQMDENPHTVPRVMYSNTRRFAFAGTDRELCDIAGPLFEGKQISLVYLIGQKFGGDWMEESLKLLCTDRRVFQGNNLYSKGACYTILKRLCPGKEEKEYIFLGPDKLKANVGMKVQKRGEEAYNALLDAGMEWTGTEEIVEFYLKGDASLELLVTPLSKAPGKHVLMELEGLQLEADQVTRIRMKLTCPAENKIQITVNDLGFGEFRRASDGKWIREVEI